MATASTSIRTLADLQKRLGGVPLDRIRLRPALGTATVQEVVTAREKQEMLCELVEGVLVEKAIGFNESCLGAYLAGVLNAFVVPRNLGIVTGADGAMELTAGLVRMPSVAFTNWDRMPGRRCPSVPIPRLAPNFAVKVIRSRNTAGEMKAKRQDYFTAGVELLWEIDPKKRTLAAYTSPTSATMLGLADILDGGTVLPRFALPVADLFGELDRQG